MNYVNNEKLKFKRIDKINCLEEILDYKDILYSFGFNFVSPSEYGGYNSLRKDNPAVLEKIQRLINRSVSILETEEAIWFSK